MASYSVIQLDHNKIELLTKAEQDMYNRAQSKYIAENTFTHASDERSLDRLILMEVLIYRWQTQLASGLDYNKQPLTHPELEQLRKNIKEGSITVAQIHNDLGLNKLQRDKDKHESVGAYLENLLRRAKEQGVKREKELDAAITLNKELFAHVNAFMRANEQERRRMGFPDEAALIKWVVEQMQPRFNKIDEYFRNNQQRYWRKEI